MEVTDVLQGRRQQPGGLQGMLSVSMAIHAALFASIVLVPTAFLHRSPPPILMTISLAGSGVGPEKPEGLTPIGGRPVQEAVPPDETPKREAVRPPAAKMPEMTMPAPNAKPVKASAPVKSALDEARGRTPTKGKEPVFGTSVAETGARGQGFGLSTGGGAGSGSSLDVADFCCPEYIAVMVVRIRSAWNMNQGAAGQTLVKFTIQRDGSIRGAEVERSSNLAGLDTAALRAVLQTRTLPPLPDPFPNPTLTVHLSFQYQ
jgi:TonB family protein